MAALSDSDGDFEGGGESIAGPDSGGVVFEKTACDSPKLATDTHFPHSIPQDWSVNLLNALDMSRKAAWTGLLGLQQ